MNRRAFFGATVGSLAAVAIASEQQPVKRAGPGPYSIEIVSPPEVSVRELPLFDSYKQAENFAQARMNLLRSNARFDTPKINSAHEAGLIKVWSSNSQVVFECAWGETWTQSTSYVDVEGRQS
jgi:hypothetical protein